jgi:hypothetical protein
MMNVIDKILGNSDRDGRELEKVHESGFLIAQKNCMADNLIKSLIGKEPIYNF